MSRHQKQQYINIFDDLATSWEAIVDKRDTAKEANFIQGVLPKKGIILDLCCGTARHSIILRQKGLNVIGMDLSSNLLEIARQRQKDARVKFPLIRADMRFFPFRNGVFTGVVNMFTSFGYLPPEDDALSLTEVSRTLKKDGRLVLDLLNRDHMVRGFKERDWAEFEPFYLLENRTLDLKNSKLRSEWTLIRKADGQIESITHEVRFYTYGQLEKLFEGAGLVAREVYGGYEKQEFNLDSSRMILTASKA